MQADFSVELGPGDESLQFPWTDPDGRVVYRDLKKHPEMLGEIEEAQQFPEFAGFLAAVNHPALPMETAKCDAWFTSEMTVEDEPFGTQAKFASYVDLLFSDERQRSFPDHEQFAQKLIKLLKRVPEIPAMAEFIVRRCHFASGESGFYFTFYLFGYGDDRMHSRQYWGIALKLVQNAIRQVFAA